MSYREIRNNALFSMGVSIVVISTCILFFRDFFSIDDNLNLFIGFFKQYGKAWLSGNIPLITPTLFFGGNAMADLQNAVFLPQNIIASIITYKLDHLRATGVFLALVNITVITFSGISIGRSLKIRSSYAYALGIFLAINPMFLYQYSGSWWNGASGHAWAIASIASLLNLIEKYSAKSIAINFVCVLFLLLAGWPHGVIGYALVCALSLIFILYKEKNIKPVALIALPSVLALICSIPIYSEYIHFKDLITRYSGFHNTTRFLSQPWGSVFMTFFPSYYDFMNYFGGYRLMLIPLGFSCLFVPLALILFKVKELEGEDKTSLIFLFSATALFFLALQTSEQFGPLRYSFRFLPFFSFSITALSFLIMDKAKRYDDRQKYYYIFIIASFFISLFSSFMLDRKHMALQVVSLLLLLLCPWVIFIKREGVRLLVLSCAGLLSLLIMLIGYPSLGKNNFYQWYPKMENKIYVDKDINLIGNILSLTGGRDGRYSLNTLNSSQFGYYDIKAINGYSPVGHKGLEALMPSNIPHVIFKPEKVLDSILSSSSYGSICVAELMKISAIAMRDDTYRAFKEKLSGCKFTHLTNASYGDVYLSRNKSDTIGWDHSIPVSFPMTSGVKLLSEGNNRVVLDIPSHDKELTLIFPRVWWPGYKALLNGERIKASPYKDALLMVNVPAGRFGILDVRYFPESWKYTLAMSFFGLVGVLLQMIMASKSSVKKGSDIVSN